MNQKTASFAKKALYKVSVVFDFIYRILVAYACVVLLGIVFIVSAQVISRKFLGGSIRWSEEVARLLMVWMAFVSIPIGIQKGLHVCIELFYNKLPSFIQKPLVKINHTVLSLCGVVMIIYGMQLILSTSTSTLSATQWPASTLYLMIPVAGLFVTYFSLIALFQLEKYIKTPLVCEDETVLAIAEATKEEGLTNE